MSNMDLELLQRFAQELIIETRRSPVLYENPISIEEATAPDGGLTALVGEAALFAEALGVPLWVSRIDSRPDEKTLWRTRLVEGGGEGPCYPLLAMITYAVEELASLSPEGVLDFANLAPPQAPQVIHPLLLSEPGMRNG